MNPGATTRSVASMVRVAGERLAGDRGDAVAVDADVGDVVEAGLGIDDPPAGDDGGEDVTGQRLRLGAGQRRRRPRGAPVVRGPSPSAAERPREHASRAGELAERGEVEGAETEGQQDATAVG